MNFNELIMTASDYTPARKYLQDRLIPDNFIDGLYANPDCTVIWGDENIDVTESEGIWINEGVEWQHGGRVPLGNDPRIVFPFYALGSAGNMSDLVGFTTRHLKAGDDGMRYQGRRYVDNAPMILNGHKVDTNGKIIFVTEGLLDCAHLPNSCSTHDYTMLPTDWKNRAVLIYDNDRDDLEDVNKLGRANAIADGWRVVNWGTAEGHPYHKDINAMAMAGMDTPQIVELVMSHAEPY